MSSLFRPLIPALLPLLLFSLAAAVDDDIDPVLRYYWEHARVAEKTFDPNVPGVSYRFTAKTYEHSVVRGGIISKTDSLIQTYFYSNGSLDSVRTIRGQAKRFKNLDLTYPSIFENRYHLNLFPNDTGGAKLAIGLRSDSAGSRAPDGLLVIDRYRYFPYSLYLFFPNKGGFSRFTRSFRFALVDDLVFPDSVWEVATQLGIFFPESYRLETGITDIQVRRADSVKKR